MAGIDYIQDCKLLQYDYYIGIILKKKTIANYPSDLSMNTGALVKLNHFFPFEAKHGFNGDIIRLNWN